MTYRKFGYDRRSRALGAVFSGSVPTVVATGYTASEAVVAPRKIADAETACVPDGMYPWAWRNPNVVYTDSKGNKLTGVQIAAIEQAWICRCIGLPKDSMLPDPPHSQARVDACWNMNRPTGSVFDDKRIPIYEPPAEDGINQKNPHKLLKQEIQELRESFRPRLDKEKDPIKKLSILKEMQDAEWRRLKEPPPTWRFQGMPNPCKQLVAPCSEYQRFAPAVARQGFSALFKVEREPNTETFRPAFWDIPDARANSITPSGHLPEGDTSPFIPPQNLTALTALKAAREKRRTAAPVSGLGDVGSAPKNLPADVVWKKNALIIGTVATAIGAGAVVYVLTRGKK